MTTTTLNDTRISAAIAARPSPARSDDLNAARGIVFAAIAGLGFWAGVLGLFFA
jgi:hypothetical protein